MINYDKKVFIRAITKTLAVIKFLKALLKAVVKRKRVYSIK